jgi:hypothetical protein
VAAGWHDGCRGLRRPGSSDRIILLWTFTSLIGAVNVHDHGERRTPGAREADELIGGDSCRPAGPNVGGTSVLRQKFRWLILLAYAVACADFGEVADKRIQTNSSWLTA